MSGKKKYIEMFGSFTDPFNYSRWYPYYEWWRQEGHLAKTAPKCHYIHISVDVSKPLSKAVNNIKSG